MSVNGLYTLGVALLSTVVLLLAACTGAPEGIEPIEDFQVERYLGKWYEIARLDHSFERGLSQVTAEYSARDDGGIRVVNRGFSEESKSWQVAEGKAYFVGYRNIGHLKVSFFGPFYGAYVICKLDMKQYQYAFVTSHNREFLWLLARTATVGKELVEDFTRFAQETGFNTDALIFVDQSGNTPGKGAAD